MKKIAILAHTLGGGGVERVVLNLTNGFLKSGHEVHLILLKNIITYNLPSEVHLHVVELSSLLSKISVVRKLYQAKLIKNILKKHSIDLVISNFTDFFGMSLVDCIGYDNTITIVHNVQSKRRFKRHNNGNTLFKKYKEYKVKKSFDSKNLVCVSKGVEDDLMQKFQIKPKKITTIYNPFDFDDIKMQSFQECKDIPKDEYIIHVGRFELNHKRQDLLLLAYKRLEIDVKLVLVGDGQDRKKIEKMIEDLGLQDKVILAGFQKNPYPWIKNAKLFVFSSDYEGFGMVLVEALALDTPVVSTNCISGPSEILTEQLAYYLVPVGDTEMLANKMREALEYYPTIGKNQLKQFHVDFIVKQYLEFLSL